MLNSTPRANLSDRYPRNGFSFFMSALHRPMSILSQWRCESIFPMSLYGAQQFEIVKDMLFRVLILLRRCFDAMTMDRFNLSQPIANEGRASKRFSHSPNTQHEGLKREQWNIVWVSCLTTK